MANDDICDALQTQIDSLQDALDETRAKEGSVGALWREIERVCQEFAFMSEGVESEDGEDDADDDDGEGDDEDREGELEFDDEDEAKEDFDEDEQ